MDFLLGSSLAVIAQQKDNTVTVFDLKSGVLHWTINTGMEVCGLRAIGKTIAVIGGEEVTAWNLPAGIVCPGARMGVEESVRTVHFSRMWDSHPMIAALVSSDFGYVAVIMVTGGISGIGYLEVYNTLTGQRILLSPLTGSTLWFLRDKHGIGWVANGNC